jgi:two-component system, OmpR family, response regulator VicR
MKAILFADDHKNIREYCRAALTKEGYRVVMARDGVEALEVFIAESPDLAILDVSMPRANGLETLEQIKRLSPRTPVILFTAQEEECRQDRRAGLASACVGKAEDLAELKRIVAQTFKRKDLDGRGDSWRMGLPPFPARMERA